MTRIALLFDNTLRPETTGIYCQRALRELAHASRITEVEHILPADLPRLVQERGRWDLIIAVDDGLAYDLPQDVAPVAYWAIDTHLDFERSLRRARQATWTFAAQQRGVEQLRQRRITARWLPLACDPELHGRQDVPGQYDWSFVGHTHAGERQWLIRLLREKYPACFVGQAYFTDMAAVYSASKIVFNRSVGDDLNMRVFEALASGSLLITNELAGAGQDELFQDGVELITYRNDDELLEKFAISLKDSAACCRIGEAGRAAVLARHTYRHRMEQLLETVFPVAPLAAAQPINNETDWLDEIDFGIKTFLRPCALYRLLTSINEQYPQARVTIVDDGNLESAEDPDSQLCRDLITNQPQFRLISLPFAAGVSAGRNALVAATDRPYLLLLDDDFCFTPETKIERLWERMQQDTQVFVAAGVCYDCHGAVRQRRSSGGTLRREGRTLIHETQAWRHHDEGHCDFVPNFALVRRTTFEQVAWRGGIGGEHYDFCLQLLDQGMTVVQDESVSIDHYPATVALPGYREHRLNYAAAQQEFLDRWNLDRVIQDGVAILERLPTAARDAAVKPTSYFEHTRSDVQELVPVTAKRILDIGCGAGRFGAALKARQTVHVTGIELNTQAAAAARSRLDDVRSANLETDELDFPDGQFDSVICADILEHLRRPEVVLKMIRRWLMADGTLVISVPNVRNHTVVQSLLAGNWTYESAGLLDADHVRFFTRRELEKLLFRAGFEVENLRMVPGEGFSAWVDQGRPREISLGGLSIRAASEGDAAEFFAYQYLAACRPAPVRSFGLTSIIVVTWNQWPYTQTCLDSLRFRTDEPYELIVVDNGSTDGTVEGLRSQSDVRLIENAENRGFPAAVNQGLQIARGENVLLLNNDTILTTGWLRRMLDVLHSDPAIGLVGPTSNRVSGAQQIPVNYAHLADLDGFAWDRRRRLVERGEPIVQETDRLIGFCLLFKREVWNAIGGLDERFGIGCFEDDDFCLRARQARFRAVIAKDSFIHHFGSVTFQASGADLGRILRENRRVYDAKWRTEEVLTEAQRRGEIEGEKENVRDGETRFPAMLSGCLIVRDNERTIRLCLESLKPWVDELVVVDTGSTDATATIAEELGARVFHWPWRDDFAAARNVSVDHARGEWIFWMDSDDVISEECGRKLRALAGGEHDKKMLGYVMQVHCPAYEPCDVTVVDHVKLFRNRSELRFEFRIHEQILPAIRRAGGDVAFTDIHVVHAGADRTKEGQAKKLERDFRLLRLDLQDRPDHPFVLFNLGMTCADCGQTDEAIYWLTQCLAVSQPVESHVRKAYALLSSVLYQQRRWTDSLYVCLRGRAVFPTDKELLFRQAMVEHQLGRLESAAANYQIVLQPTSDRHFVSIDAGLAGYKARHNLALVYEDLGRHDLAEAQWQAILAERPDYRPAQIGLEAARERQRDPQPHVTRTLPA